MPKFKVRCVAEITNCFMVIEAATAVEAREKAVFQDYLSLDTVEAEIGEIGVEPGCPVEQIKEDTE